MYQTSLTAINLIYGTKWVKRHYNPTDLYLLFVVRYFMESQIENANSREYQRGVLRNIQNEMNKETRNSLCNWSIVKIYLLNHTSKGGRTSAYKHCEFLRIDPDGYSFY